MGTRDLSGVTEMFQNWIVVIVVKLCKFIKNHRIVHLKLVNLMVCKLYLNKSRG